MAKVDKINFEKKMKRLEGVQKEVMPKAFQYFKDLTPIDTGYARQNTVLRNFIIYAKYKYSTILDNGRVSTPKGMRGSTQAPRGMSIPTIEKFKEWVILFIRKSNG
jgi:hypothetical protein